MKKAIVGMFIAGILIAGAAVGFGVALAEGYPSENPAWTLQDQEAVEQYKDYAVGPMGKSGSEGSMFGAGWQASGAIGAGAVPGADSEAY